jgi:hypothetical protein
VRVDDGDDVIGTDGEAVVRRISRRDSALRALEANAQTVEALDEHRRRTGPVSRLLDRG